MSNRPANTVVSGSVTVTTAQTPVQLSTTALKTPCFGIWIAADNGNTGKEVAIGGSAATTNAKLKVQQGLVLREFTPVFVEVDDPTKVWVDVETSGDKVTWLALIL